MAFGLVEILADGWLWRDEVVFQAQEAAVLVATSWRALRRLKIGVADRQSGKLVWRSDPGALDLPCLSREQRE